MTKLQQLAQLGQSVWYDYIQRSLLESTDFKNLIRGGLRGITSNPSIFQKAISNTSDYDPALAAMKGKDINEIYEALVLKDIGQAADLFRPLFDATNGLDGYVSEEVLVLGHHLAAEAVLAMFLSISLSVGLTFTPISSMILRASWSAFS